MTSYEIKEGLIFGLGNPLLDISANVDNEFLKKWGLEKNAAVLAEDKHKGLVEDMIKHHEVKYIAGGATQNTMRIIQWLTQTPKVTSFVGCIGNDFFGKCMAAKSKEEGVNTAYEIDKSEKTGHCCVLITGRFRSLCAYLGAANNFRKEHLMTKWDLVEKAKICYISGFHLTVSPDSIMAVAHHCNSKDDKLFMFNLSADFICKFFSEKLLDVIPYVDLLLANETETAAFGSMMGWTDHSVPEIALKIANIDRKSDKKKRLVVITQGPESIYVANQGRKEYSTFNVPALKKEQIIDTNGAGDAFAAGFIVNYIQNKPISECVKYGNYSAQIIIQRDGCSVPDHPPKME